MMKTRLYGLLLLAALAGGAGADSIDPYNAGEQYAWGENIGWLNAEPDPGDGVIVYGGGLAGWIWSESIGWIRLSIYPYAGVINDGKGNLSGFAWAENAGWINFDPEVPGDSANVYRVRIEADGKFSGWAWGENIGWIRFDSTQGWDVRTCVVTIEDLGRFASYWLQKGASPANLDGQGAADLADFAVFSAAWMDYCPRGWPLK